MNEQQLLAGEEEDLYDYDDYEPYIYCGRKCRKVSEYDCANCDADEDGHCPLDDEPILPIPPDPSWTGGDDMKDDRIEPILPIPPDPFWTGDDMRFFLKKKFLDDIRFALNCDLYDHLLKHGGSLSPPTLEEED